jgi:hypothetical protein
VAVAIGINERNVEASGTTLYNSLLYIDAEGRKPADGARGGRSAKRR